MWLHHLVENAWTFLSVFDFVGDFLAVCMFAMILAGIIPLRDPHGKGGDGRG